MANDNNDISDIVKKCKILLLDIEGTTTSISFVKDKLFPYAEEHVKDFLNTQWDIEDVKEAVAALQKLALEDKEKGVDGVVEIPGEDASKEDQIEGLVKSVKWQMSSDRKVGALKQLQGLIWKQGYDNGDIKGHVYDDVSPALELWRSVEDQKVYIYSSGSVQAQKLLFGQSSSGDLLKLIDGHFDTGVGAKQEAVSYTTIAEKIGSKPEEILFLTDIVKEAEAARASGVQTALVSREGNAPLPSEATAAYPVLFSLAQLANPKKRKPDAQDEQPAKVPKTDVDTDVKTASETEAFSEVKESSKAEVPTTTEITSKAKATSEAEAPSKPEVPITTEAKSETTAPTKTADEPEKMEVEEEVVAKGVIPAEAKSEEVTEKVETIVEEVTDSNEIADTPVCETEPVIEESKNKPEKLDTEKMETDTSETVTEPKESAELKNGEKDAPVPEETPPTITMEIKDVTDDKEELNEEVEMIEGLEPVVEEPPAAQDMEDLQNVGEVLEKECDEILSKVQDVTNLDNIPIKPLLNTIAEETMETDNLDTSDIVEGILDSEMEMELKQSADKEITIGQQISQDKAAAEEKRSKKKEAAKAESIKVASEVKPTEKVEDVKVTEEKAEESSPKETKVEDKKVAADENKTKTEEVKVEKKMETEVSSTPEMDGSKTKTEESKPEEIKTVEKLDTEEKKVEADKPQSEKIETPAEQSKIETPAEQSKKETEIPAETTEKDIVPDEVKPENEAVDTKETQVNGKATNGDAKSANLNGDSSKEDELSSRLSMENGKEEVNGANGDSTEADQSKSATSAEVEVAEIKVKTVAVDEPRNDPIEQPTEA